MTEFSVDSIDWDQAGGGTPHAIPDIQAQLPARARPYRTFVGSDRANYIVCLTAYPLRYRPSASFDWTRTQQEYRRYDEQGSFLLVQAIALCALFVGQQLHAGMRSLAVRVAFVVDNTLAYDERMDFEKCDYIGQGEVTDITPIDTPASAGAGPG